MPSRMNDEAFLYLVYGTSSLMNSHVAWSMRKVTTRDFPVTRSPRLREAVIDGHIQSCHRLYYLWTAGERLKRAQI